MKIIDTKNSLVDADLKKFAIEHNIDQAQLPIIVYLMRKFDYDIETLKLIANEYEIYEQPIEECAFDIADRLYFNHIAKRERRFVYNYFDLNAFIRDLKTEKIYDVYEFEFQWKKYTICKY